MRDEQQNKVAFLFSRVPGKQTVPRSELWALLQLIRRMKTGRAYKVYIDAAYVLNGIHSRSNNYSKGSNGDIWSSCFEELDRIDLGAIKVKSHVTSG